MQYAKGRVTVSIPGYIEKGLQRLTPNPTPRQHHSPHAWIAPDYDASVQYTVPADTSFLLDAQGINRQQQIIETLLSMPEP
jgi:hypothetical protein